MKKAIQSLFAGLLLFFYTPLLAQQIKLNCRETGGRISVSWIAAADSADYDFVVERSSDGVHYQEIGTVQPSKTCSSNCSYSYSDRQPIHGMNFYRLSKRSPDAAQIVSAIARKDFSSNAKPFKLLTSGSQVTVQARQNLVRITVWKSNGQRLLDKEGIASTQFSFTSNNRDRFYFIMLELADGSRFTEKLGLQ